MIRRLIAPLCCASLLAVSGLAWAEVSRDDAAAMAQRATGGRVLSVDRSEAGGRAVWRVKVLAAGGEVRVIAIDAEGGGGGGGGGGRNGGPGRGGHWR